MKCNCNSLNYIILINKKTLYILKLFEKKTVVTNVNAIRNLFARSIPIVWPNSINLFSLCFIYLTITDTVRTFQYSVANIKLEVTGKNESFLNNTYMNRNSIGMTTGSTNTIKTGLSKRKPVFLNARTLDDWGNIKYSDTARGNKLLFFEGHRFIKNNIYGSNIYWKCSKWHSNCKARAITSLEVPSKCIIKGVHNHPLALDD